MTGWDGQTERRKTNDEKLDRILLLLEDPYVGICGRMMTSEHKIRVLERWRSYLTGAYVAAGVIIGALMGRK